MKKVLLAIAIMALMAVPAMAAAPSTLTSGGGINTKQYHSYDGLICSDCHTMHGSENGAFVQEGKSALPGTGGYRELLYKNDWTDMCLSCHKQGYNTSATADLPSVVDSSWIAPIVMTTDGIDPAGISMPAGDFYYSNDNPKKGHNPAYTKSGPSGPPTAATSKLMKADPDLGSAPPGGAIADGEWSCHSCHGMHSRFSGSYTAYRQLKRKVNNINVSGDVSGFGVETVNGGTTAAGYEPLKSNTRGDLGANGLVYTNFRKDTQPLQGADLYADYSDTNKNVYQGGFSSFCSACHGDFHGGIETTKALQNTNVRANGAWIKHPTNLKLSESSKYGVAGYTAVVTSSVGTVNPNPTGYDWKYPLVKADGDFTTTRTGSGAVTGDDRIMCLTCHKAHASQYENMTRWDTNAHSFIANGATDFEGEASTGDNPAYGCGKCHQKGGTKAYVKGAW